MRRWFVLLMLVVLPVQLTWAAAGHAAHAHDHPAHHGSHVPDLGHDTVDLTIEADGASDPSPHLGCDHCHGHCVGLLETRSIASAQATGTAAPSSPDAPRAESAPAAPERPQWVRLA